MQDVDKAWSQARAMKTMVGDAEFLPDIWVGDMVGDGGSDVCKSCEAQRRLASDMLSIPNNVVEWLDNTLITLDNRCIKSIQIVLKKGQTFVMAWSDSAQSEFQPNLLLTVMRFKAGVA